VLAIAPTPAGTAVTETVYRHQLRPVLLGGAATMDRIFGSDGQTDSASTSTVTQSSRWGPALVTANASLDSVTQTTVAAMR
jgi:hypothetical protein